MIDNPAPAEGAAPAQLDRTKLGDLDRSLVHGVAWTGMIKWTVQILSWAATVVIARLLSPAEYGIMAMATVYHGLVQIVNEFGLGSAIVRQRDLSEQQIAALGGASMALSFALWGLSVLLAFPIAWFFREPVVAWIIIVLGFTFVTTGLKVLPRALLTRDLAFKRVAALDAVEALTMTAATLILALLGFSYWSLALGSIAGGAVSCAVALVWRPHRRVWPTSFSLIKNPITFGWHLVVARFAWSASSGMDLAVIGRLFDTVILGGYSYAMAFATMPMTRITSLIGQVIPAILSAVQNERAQLRRYTLRLTEALAIVTSPICIGLALVAPEFVTVALGPKWNSAIVPLQILAVSSAIRSVSSLHSHVLAAAGRSRDLMQLGLMGFVVLPVAFVVGALLGGAPGVAMAWIVGYPLVIAPALRAALEVADMRLSEYLGALRPAVFASLGMAAVVLGVDALMPDGTSPFVLLIVKSAVGAAAYTLLMFTLYGKRVRELLTMVRGLRK